MFVEHIILFRTMVLKVFQDIFLIEVDLFQTRLKNIRLKYKKQNSVDSMLF
jgi:hypothetical protein